MEHRERVEVFTALSWHWSAHPFIVLLAFCSLFNAPLGFNSPDGFTDWFLHQCRRETIEFGVEPELESSSNLPDQSVHTGSKSITPGLRQLVRLHHQSNVCQRLIRSILSLTVSADIPADVRRNQLGALDNRLPGGSGHEHGQSGHGANDDFSPGGRC